VSNTPLTPPLELELDPLEPLELLEPPLLDELPPLEDPAPLDDPPLLLAPSTPVTDPPQATRPAIIGNSTLNRAWWRRMRGG
jgi:hypothetical protein